MVAQAEAPFVPRDSCPQRAVDYITGRAEKRDVYPEVPPQNYLSEEVRMAAAEYMLKVEN